MYTHSWFCWCLTATLSYSLLTSAFQPGVLILEFLRTQSLDCLCSLSTFTPWVISCFLIASDIICTPTALFPSILDHFSELQIGIYNQVLDISPWMSQTYFHIKLLILPIKPTPVMDSQSQLWKLHLSHCSEQQQQQTPSISLIPHTQYYRISSLSYLQNTAWSSPWSPAWCKPPLSVTQITVWSPSLCICPKSLASTWCPGWSWKTYQFPLYNSPNSSHLTQSEIQSS